MQIIVMRHGKAAFVGPDRVLTKEGEVEALNTALKLHAHYHLTKVFASPKTRAQSTAKIVANARLEDKLEVLTLKDLTPSGDPRLAIDYALTDANDDDCILLVSHIPLVESLCYELSNNYSPIMFDTANALVFEAEHKEDFFKVKALFTPSSEKYF